MKPFAGLGPLLQLGWIVALCTLVPLGLGVWMDRRFDTAPLFILIGGLLGILTSTFGAVRVVGRTIDALGKRPEREADDASGPGKSDEEKEDQA